MVHVPSPISSFKSVWGEYGRPYPGTDKSKGINTLRMKGSLLSYFKRKYKKKGGNLKRVMKGSVTVATSD